MELTFHTTVEVEASDHPHVDGSVEDAWRVNFTVVSENNATLYIPTVVHAFQVRTQNPTIAQVVAQAAKEAFPGMFTALYSARENQSSDYFDALAESIEAQKDVDSTDN